MSESIIAIIAVTAGAVILLILAIQELIYGRDD